MTKIAVAGAQDSLGREVLSLLEEDGIPAADIVALDSKAPLGTMVSYGEDDELDVFNLDDCDFNGIDLVIFATPSALSKRFAPKALNKGAKVIDCSDAFFSEADVPLIIAGVNDDKIMEAPRRLVAIPSAPVTQMLLPLSEIHKNLRIKRIIASTYSSASIYGKEAMDELFNQTRKIFMNDTLADDQKVFHKQIAFNVIPQVEEFIGEETACEWAINAQTKKIWGGDIKVHANCAVIPAFIGSAQYVNVECAGEVDVDEIRKQMKATKGVVVFDKNVDGGYVTINDVQGESEIYVSRLRQDVSVDNGFSFWCVADNLRAGVAKNAFNVMKLMLAAVKH
ncbi:MAG: aspartate-semialdehyde dehydrogenase [Alphaproteobacteria bacterium]|nr:aspartate-semialdehyde dehydrogenase [Alphaproteobacteria bacterium]